VRLITSGQLVELGVSRRQRHALVEAGWLHILAPNVFGVAGVPPSIERRLMLGLLALGPAAVVSHEAAARLHGFDRAVPGAVEFSVARSRRNAGRPVHGPFDT
jgi:hypothetical protein